MTFDCAPNDTRQAVLCAGELLRKLESPELIDKPLKVLVAVSPGLLDDDHHDLKEQANGMAPPPAGQRHVLIQICAETEDEMIYARRLIKRLFVGHLELRDEIYGNRNLLNREPFGYADRPSPDRDTVPVSPDEGGATWLIFQKCVQNVDEFYRLPVEQQNALMGKERTPRAGGDFRAPDDAHVVSAHALNVRDGLAKVLRRSFSYETFREAGLVFLAVAAIPRYLLEALRNFQSAPLSRFVRLDVAGLYVIPPSASWLTAGARAPSSSTAGLLPEDSFAPDIPVVLYEITEKTHDFFVDLFHRNKDNFDEHGALRPDLLLYLKGLAKLLSGTRIRGGSPLFKFLTAIFTTDTAAEPARINHSPELERQLHELARARESYDRTSAESSPGDTRASEPADRSLAIMAEKTAETLLRGDAIRHVLPDAALGSSPVNTLVRQMVLEDAEFIHSKSRAEKEAIDRLVASANAAADEARQLNAKAGEYLTFMV